MKIVEKKLFISLFPSIIMIIIAGLSFHNKLFFSSEHGFAIFVVSLMFIFPSLYALQGSLCGKGKGNVVIGLGISSITFLLILIVFMNSTALPYILGYVVIGVIAYIISSVKNKGSALKDTNKK